MILGTSLRLLMRVAVASSSVLAARAGASVAETGGNAVDAALAATLVAATTEPGITSLGGGGFVTVWPEGDDPVTIDGYAEMPGRAAGPARMGQGAREVSFPYGGGVTTFIGHGSVATPGSLAALHLAHSRYGMKPWSDLFGPAIRLARDGFPMPAAAVRYLRTSYDAIYVGSEAATTLIRDGNLIGPEETVVVPGLAETLTTLAEEGPDSLYRGTIGDRLSDDMHAHGGILGRLDLDAYRPVVRPPITVDIDGWTVVTNPPPAFGGGTLAAMLLGTKGDWTKWDLPTTERMIGVQTKVLGYRRARLDQAPDVNPEMARMLEAAARGELSPAPPGSTAHTSAVDEGRLGCAITVSFGYGSGVVVPGTGLWLNNHLGEMELNRLGLHSRPPGARLSSNMAPTIARRKDGATLVVGSPGADRIATALLHVIVNFVKMGMDLGAAISAPRLHVEDREGRTVVAYEAGLPVDQIAGEARRFEEIDMFFGGVAAAVLEPEGRLLAASDPRRQGGVAYG